MSGVTASMVKDLRERTGAGMMDCKKALIENACDVEKAIDWLRQKGIAKAAKKAGRVASEGLVQALIADDGRSGVLLEVNCETDFAARNEQFQSLVADLARHTLEKAPKVLAKEDLPEAEQGEAAKLALLEQPFAGDESQSVQDFVTAAIATIGENISVRRFTRYELEGAGVVHAYIHGAGRIGVLIEVGCEKAGAASDERFTHLVKDLAMHIAASSPKAIGREDLPQDLLEKEREVYRAQALEQGKPEKIVDRIVDGRIEKYYQEVCLLEQGFVKDSDKTVAAVIEEVGKALGETITVRRFSRYQLGEGIEKRADDFAAEVAKAAGG